MRTIDYATTATHREERQALDDAQCGLLKEVRFGKGDREVIQEKAGAVLACSANLAGAMKDAESPAPASGVTP